MDKLTLGLLAAVAAVAGVVFYGARKDAVETQRLATSIESNPVIHSPFKGDDGMVIRSPFKGDDGMVIRSPFKGDDGIVTPPNSNGTDNS